MQPLVSVVTGTYDRLKYLINMVKTVRLSVGVGIPYEIILVDGGSTDGTIEWAELQLDIVLIKQGELLGAVKAFNAGTKVARGKYVILANDDITFVNESILLAISYMERNKEVGIGCFYQDRYKQDWHVEYITVMEKGKLRHNPYGQVCIVPKWLGDKIGWWSEEYHTYAADNDMTCKMLELGYKVEAIDGACIHDLVCEDKLRVINNPNTKLHPDSELYSKKWRKPKFLGATIPEYSKIRDESNILRVLYAPIFEYGNKIQQKTKHGLRDALAKYSAIVEVDYINRTPNYILDIADQWQPDLILTQFHDTNLVNAKFVADMKKCSPGAILVNWNGDCFPENFLTSAYMDMMSNFDLATFVQTMVRDKYDKAGIPWYYWQIGFEPCNRKPDSNTPKHDVLFLGNGHYDFRIRLGKMLRSLPNYINTGIYGGWSAIKADGQNLYDFSAGGKLYSNCKIAISDTRPGCNAFVSNRLFEAMASGSFVLQEYVDELDTMNGLKNRENIIFWNNLEELKDLIIYWLDKDRDAERKNIADNAYRYALSQCTFDAKVRQLFTKLGLSIYI